MLSNLGVNVSAGPSIDTRAQGSFADTNAAGNHQVLYIDWASFNPNVSLFGTVNPPVCLPRDQREEDNGKSGCIAWLQTPEGTARPVRVAAVLTRDGWRLLSAFDASSEMLRETAAPQP